MGTWKTDTSTRRKLIDFGYGVILKGNGLRLVAWDIVGMVVLGAGLFAFSVWYFERNLAR